MEFPTLPLIGGALIGTSAMLLLAGLGRVAGITGICWAAVSGPDRGWRFLFLAGLLAGGVVATELLSVPVPEIPEGPLPVAVVAGLLVGFGTRRGGGCTSGHGVCGIGRQSRRSIVATGVFMAFGVISVFVFHQVLGVMS